MVATIWRCQLDVRFPSDSDRASFQEHLWALGHQGGLQSQRVSYHLEALWPQENLGGPSRIGHGSFKEYSWAFHQWPFAGLWGLPESP